MLSSFRGFAQKESYNWYFGSRAAITWNSGTVTAVPGSAMSAGEGCAAMSDSSGKLLFYTDGNSVYDASNSPMPNGTSLKGSSLAAQSAVAVKQPGNNSNYLVFTVSDWWVVPTHLCYSVIDMSLNHGKGDVIPVNKNSIVNKKVSECVTATNHGNGQDMWIISHERESNVFVSYRLTATGLSSDPVISAVGSVSFAGHNRYGYLRISPKGDKLCVTLGGDETGTTVELFDFDNTTGKVSKPVVLCNSGSLTSAYCSEFSPDGTKLYVAGLIASFYQYDLTASNIVASRTTIVGSGSSRSALQLGPDNRIYVAIRYANRLGAITEPNLAGTACAYNDDAVTLSGSASIGLPNFCKAYVVKQPPKLQPPQPPRIQCVNIVNDSTITLTWQPPVDSARFSHYRQYSKVAGYQAYIFKDSIAGWNTTTSTYLKVKATADRPVHFAMQTMADSGSVLSDSARSIVLKDSIISKGVFCLYWNSSLIKNTSVYYVEKNNGTGWEVVDSTEGLTYVYRACLIGGRFRVYQQEKTSGCFSYSNERETKVVDIGADNVSAPVYVLSASVGLPNRVAHISWLPPAGWAAKEYKVYKKDGVTGEHIFLALVRDTFCTDTSAITASHCYFIEPYDYCGNAGQRSNQGCLIIASGKTEKEANHISWNPYRQWVKGVSHYTVYRNLDSTGWEVIAKVTEPRYTDRDMTEDDIQSYCYKVEARADSTGGPAAGAWSTVVCLSQESIIYMPGTFTPNDSKGLNDVFAPVGAYVNSFEMQIYNRWGERIYRGAKGWDGSFRGEPVQADVYLYIVTIRSHNGFQYYRTGTLTLTK